MAESHQVAQPATQKETKPQPGKKPKPGQLPLFNVILLDDDDHTYDYVIDMLESIFAHPQPQAFRMAKTVDQAGRVIVCTTHKELAELKRDQILAYGGDFRIPTCEGSMSAVIEPVDG
ncbi:MAG TPA: ATP-dependent Clp protease adaptor ClpS [Tepidisphaeraceae bacterium]|jgi:ATP-dependent Clp protease adaptor protein ClpS